RPVADRLERLHDVRLVRSSQVQDIAAVDRGYGLMEHRLCRILVRGSCQPYRTRGLLSGRVEDDPGSGDAVRLCGVLGALPEGSDLLEPSRRLLADRRGRGPDLQGVTRRRISGGPASTATIAAKIMAQPTRPMAGIRSPSS